MKQGFELTRERTVKGVTSVETAYGITNLPTHHADAACLLAMTQAHWGIENGLHYRRDVSLGEDASRIRTGAAPQVMAGLRNSVIHLLSQFAAPSLASALRTMAHCLDQALHLLGLPQIE